MSKQAKDRRLAPAEAMSKVRNLRTGARKLNLVAQSIRNLPVQRALNELEFSPKRIASDVRKCLNAAISNAENNHGLDIDNLVVAEAYIGKNLGDEALLRPRAGSLVQDREAVLRDHYRRP